MLVPTEWTEQRARLSLVPFLLPSRLASRSGGSSLFLIAYPLHLLSGEVMFALSFLTEVDQGVWGAASAEAPREEKLLQGVSALLLPWATWQQAFPCCSHPPWGKEGRRKIRLGLRSIDLPAFTWLRGITSRCQSQKERFTNVSFSAEAQGDELWLGGETREALLIRQIHQKNVI